MPAVTVEGYIQSKQRSQILQRRAVAEFQECGPIPAVVDEDRRRRCFDDFEAFCFTYFPQLSTRPWADHHRICAAKMQDVAQSGGWFAFALPRGDLKSTLCRFMTLWLSFTGRSLYTILLAASQQAAEKRLSVIKKILITNPLLWEDWPEVIHPIRHMDGSTRRCAGQTHNGEKTAMEWLTRHIVLPTIEGSAASGSRIECYGLTGEIRGTDHGLTDGRVIRPQVVFADDPQTRESARSRAQSADRERILVGDVAYLNGPTSKTTVIMPCTVIYEGDLADRMLDRKRNPQWRGERHKMIDQLPKNLKLWEQYESLLIEAANQNQTTDAATEFYQQNRAAMDEGCKATWEHRYNDDEVSAIQHAMNLYFRDRESFFAEAQNQPVVEGATITQRSAMEIEERMSGFGRHKFPETVQHITAFVDIQGKILYYCLIAFDHNFTGYIIDYGAWPRQRRRYYTLGDVTYTLSRMYGNRDQAGLIYAGLEQLTEELFTRSYVRDDGTHLHISRMLIDSGWPESKETVRVFARGSKYASAITPSIGRGITASRQPMSAWQEWRKMRRPDADNWVLHKPFGSRIQSITYDSNYWKYRVVQALNLDVGDPGALSLYEVSNNMHGHHRMLADHLCSERPVKTEANGRVVYEFHLRPGVDNHLLDCVVGCFVAASMCGVTQKHAKPRKQKQTKRKKRAAVYYR